MNENKLYVAMNRIYGAKGTYIVIVKDAIESKEVWTLEPDRIYVKNNKDIRLYKGCATRMSMNEYEWLYELDKSEYDDLMEKAVPQ